MSEFEYDDLGRLVRMDGYSSAELEAMERQEREADVNEERFTESEELFTSDEEEASEESDGS